MVIFVAQKAQGIKDISWVSFVAGFTPLLILSASFFNKKAYWKSEPRDYYLMAAAIIGIILWAITDNPNFAILFSLIADVLAALPTLIKVGFQVGLFLWKAMVRLATPRIWAISSVDFPCY